MISALFTILLAAGGAESAPTSSSVGFFERLKSLRGEWSGSVEWTGARTGTGTMQARYHLTGNGTAVVEDLLGHDGVVVMTSVYHLDGADLRLTHYCGAGNQPRLKASFADPAAGVARFTFVDVTNLARPEAGHVRGVELQLRNERRITLTFTFSAAGEDSYERIELTRVPEA
jgi:hypothetical protein